MAILSIAVLVIPLLGALAAMVFGSFAIASTKRAAALGQPIRGRRLAIVGCIAGVVLFFTQVWTLDWLAQHFRRGFDQSVAAALTETFAVTDEESAKRLLASWSPHADDRVSPGAIVAFANEARNRYGPFTSLSIVSSEPDEASTLSRQSVTMAISFRFERGERFGSVVTVLTPNPERVVIPAVRIAAVMIDDREAGALRLAPTASPTLHDRAPDTQEATNGG